MMVRYSTFAATLASVSLFTSRATASCCEPQKLDSLHYPKIIDQYLNAWNGNFGLVNSTFTPDAHLHSDRIVTSDGTKTNGSISISLRSAEQIKGFMQLAHVGWDRYQFDLLHWAGGEGYNVAIRWQLDGVIGKDFTKPTTLKEGDPVTCNGTDFLQLDACSGLIKHVDLAQDYITFYHSLGDTELNI